MAHPGSAGDRGVFRQHEVESLLHAVGRVVVRVAVDTLNRDLLDGVPLLCVHHLLGLLALAPGEEEIAALIDDRKVPVWSVADGPGGGALCQSGGGCAQDVQRRGALAG